MIDDALKNFIESEVTAMIGTCGEELMGEVTYIWGPRVLAGGREIEIFVDKAAGAQTIRNLRNTRRAAVTFTSPITVRAVQAKGWCVEIDEPLPGDEPWLERHRAAFGEVLRARGMPAHVSRSFWSRDVIRVRLSVEELFDQTPGPGAGRRL